MAVFRSTSGTAEYGKHDSLQIYRAIAAFVVVLHHINGKFSADHYYGQRVPDYFYWGQAGVDFFFVLSGFIIAGSLSRSKTAGAFLIQRAIRIYPPLWLAFICTLLVATAMSRELHTPVSLDWQSLLKGLLLLPQPNPPAIGVAWTLHHEVLFYAIAGAWIGFPVIASAIGLTLLAGSFLSFDSFLIQFLFSPFHWQFAAGVAAFFLAPKLPSQWARPIAGMAAVAAWTFCIILTEPGGVGGIWTRLLALTPCFAILVAASTRFPPRVRAHKCLPLRAGLALGESSYTLYLWHVPLVTPMTKLAFKVMPQAQPAIVLLAGSVIAVAAAVLSHLIFRYIEQPTVSALSRWMAKPKTQSI